MMKEREYLLEVYRILDGIRRAPDETRKQKMRDHLHRKVYPLKGIYGFATTQAVRKSVEYLAKGQPDPTREERYVSLKRRIGILSKALDQCEKERIEDGLPVTGRKLEYGYDKLKSEPRKNSPEKDKEPETK